MTRLESRISILSVLFFSWLVAATKCPPSLKKVVVGQPQKSLLHHTNINLSLFLHFSPTLSPPPPANGVDRKRGRRQVLLPRAEM